VNAVEKTYRYRNVYSQGADAPTIGGSYLTPREAKERRARIPNNYVGVLEFMFEDGELKETRFIPKEK
jgi:hypothetical protein